LLFLNPDFNYTIYIPIQHVNIILVGALNWQSNSAYIKRYDPY